MSGTTMVLCEYRRLQSVYTGKSVCVINRIAGKIDRELSLAVW